MADYAAKGADYAEGVFVTDSRQFGRAWACSYGRRHGAPRRGTLYQVRPEGELVRDPDYLFGTPVSWHCPRAVVVRVVEVDVSMTETEEVRAVAPYAFWTDGSPQYTPDGLLTYHPEHAKTGVTPEMPSQLGPWRSIYSDLVNYELSFMVAQKNGEVPADATLDEFRAELRAHVASGGSLPPIAYPGATTPAGAVG